jgi:hypothetical protein
VPSLPRAEIGAVPAAPDTTPQARAAQERFVAVAEAFGTTPGQPVAARADEVVQAHARLTDLVAAAVMGRPDLTRGLGGSYVPAPGWGRGPRNAAERLLWDLCVRYERVAGLLEVYVADERVLTVPLTTLRTPEPSLN